MKYFLGGTKSKDDPESCGILSSRTLALYFLKMPDPYLLIMKSGPKPHAMNKIPRI